MRIAEGFARKVSLAFIGISFIGWMVFTAGFGQYYEWVKDNDIFSDQKSAFYAFWAGSVIGPFLHIIAVAHVLLWGLPSSIIGSVTSVLSIMYISAVGYCMVGSGIYIEALSDVENTADIDYEFDNGVKLMFAGGFLTTLFWAMHLAFWPWFKKEEGSNTTNVKDYSTF